MDRAPVEWQAAFDAMPEADRDKVRRSLEGTAERAAMLAAYADARAGAGYGDQGHKAAVKAANKAGRLVWCKAFGYNGFHELTI
jgi:hypothetical protein